MTGTVTYTVATAAIATGLSEATIRRAINTGDLPTNRPQIGARTIASVLIPADALTAWATGADAKSA